MAYVLGVDLGTTGLKAALVDDSGAIAGVGYREYPLNVPQTGCAEQNPEQWHEAMCLAIRDVLAKTRASAQDVRGVGFSGQMHGLVPLDAQKNVLCPAIIHCDGRARKQKAEIIEMVGMEKLGKWVQNQVHSGFQALTLLWLRENRPQVYGRIRFALLPKDYLRYRLTGEIGTEPTDAGGTLMYDGARGRWSDELLGALGVDKALLPNADHRPYEIAGAVTEKAARETGLTPGTPVAFGGGDAPMQAVGNGVIAPGDACVNIGTSGQVFSVMDKPVYDLALRTHTFPHAPKDTWYVMGAVLNACLAYNWFGENVCGERDFAKLDAEAARVKPGAGGLLFLPYLTGERTPYMNERARGAFLGLTLGHGRADMTRAVMEGVAFALCDALDVVRSLNVPAGRMIVSGGGAKSALWRQIVADVLETPLGRSSMKEQAALGAALCARVALGDFSDLREACKAVARHEPDITRPQAQNAARYREARALYREAYRQNAPLFERMLP